MAAVSIQRPIVGPGSTPPLRQRLALQNGWEDLGSLSEKAIKLQGLKNRMCSHGDESDQGSASVGQDGNSHNEDKERLESMCRCSDISSDRTVNNEKSFGRTAFQFLDRGLNAIPRLACRGRGGFGMQYRFAQRWQEIKRTATAVRAPCQLADIG